MDAQRAALTGSAPRVRGTRSCAAADDLRSRFSPACAGNTGRASAQQQSRGSAPRVRGTRTARAISRNADPVQPRVCGEHRGEYVSGEAGSAPRVRGTRVRMPAEIRCGRRFSPACAGNTRSWDRPLAGPVQPRVCGEHLLTRSAGLPSGSAPRVRGTLLHSAPGASGPVQPRVCGEHPRAVLPCAVIAVQPRVCGEHQCCAERP